LQRKPFDRELLDQFAEMVRGRGQVCEIGCGPWQIARYLQDRQANMCGIDLSEEMIKWARRPTRRFYAFARKPSSSPDSQLDQT